MHFSFSLENRKIFSYATYRQMLAELMAKGKTTGNDHSPKMIEYTKMNLVRMNRWDKTAVLTNELIELLQHAPTQKWLLLSEGWCGDAAQNLPIINKMIEATISVDLEIILRDENLDIMDAYLTNGGRSVPKLIAVDENNEVLFTWGPRPQQMQEKAMELKKEGLEYAEEVHKMYARDKAQTLQLEFIKLLRAISR